MTERQSAQEAYERIDVAIRRMEDRTPQLSNILTAFRELMAQQAAVKADLPEPAPLEIEVDTAQYTQGVPLLDKEFFAISWDSLKKAAPRLLPAMEKGFPNLYDQFSALQNAIEKTDSGDAPLARSLVTGDGEATRKVAEELGIDPSVIDFAGDQLRKPFVEKVASAVPALPSDIGWLKGYCPLCGSWPELSYLEGKEGRRWLRCCFCGHEWPFMRTQCPFCEADNLDDIEIIFQESRPYERAELCHACKKYVVSVDFRDLAYELPHEVASLGLVYLDILAQEKGFSPGAVCPWNVLK
jgi:FdhE protein